MADFSERFGTEALQNITFRNDLETDSIEALARVGVRIGQSPLVVHADFSGNGDHSSVAVGLTLRGAAPWQN